jgi:hypothetical protein
MVVPHNFTSAYGHYWYKISNHDSSLSRDMRSAEGRHRRTYSPLAQGGRSQHSNNWSLITLLNVSHKIFAKALQMRLQPVLMELVSPDQSAFLPMRYILDNIFLTQETIAYAKQSNQSLLFLKLDFSKTYDKVDLPFLFQALHRLGFPALFVRMVRLLFENASTRVLVNGRVTSLFPIQ